MAEKPVAIADRSVPRDAWRRSCSEASFARDGRSAARMRSRSGRSATSSTRSFLSHVEPRARFAWRGGFCLVDRLEAPTPAEWALAAMLHDLVQCAHPELTGVFRGRAPSRLLQIAALTAERVAAPATVGEAVSRHTWFSRALEITRTDTNVSFWVGKRTFLGKEPPTRLLAWPELRRVHVDKTPRTLLDLPAAGGHVDLQAFADGVGAWLRKTPLTDLATCARTLPKFAWSRETLELVSTRARSHARAARARRRRRRSTSTSRSVARRNLSSTTRAPARARHRRPRFSASGRSRQRSSARAAAHARDATRPPKTR